MPTPIELLVIVIVVAVAVLVPRLGRIADAIGRAVHGDEDGEGEDGEDREG